MLTNMYERKELQLIIKRIREPRKFIQTLLGPRQVGKTTLIRQAINSVNTPWIYTTADEKVNADETWLRQQWEMARMRLKNSEEDELLLIIDEIQKVDDWSSIVKSLWDDDTFNLRNLKVILSGSARLLLQKGLTESMAGRFEIIHIMHWNYTEMKNAFGISANEYVWYGGYPGAIGLVSEYKRWVDYIVNSMAESTISKDILMLTRIDKPALLRRLFELGCAYSGQILSLTKVLGQLQDAGNTVTLAHYLQLLDSAGILAGLDKFAGQQMRSRASVPKFQVYNSAYMSAYSGITLDVAMSNPDIWGRHVESAIGAYLLNAAKINNMEVYYWRERDKEVDYIVKYNNKIVALEVKSGARKAISGVKAFDEQFKPEKSFVVGTGGFPWSEFLEINPTDLF